MRASIDNGNINKKARITIGDTKYRLVQPPHARTESGEGIRSENLAIWAKRGDEPYVYFGEAGIQEAIDELPIDQKKEFLATRVRVILGEL